MEIRVLRYFLETAREGNITRAAERLHVTQPTMSRQLKDLEEELGKKLFVRTNYALRLTEAEVNERVAKDMLREKLPLETIKRVSKLSEAAIRKLAKSIGVAVL